MSFMLRIYNKIHLFLALHNLHKLTFHKSHKSTIEDFVSDFCNILHNNFVQPQICLNSKIKYYTDVISLTNLQFISWCDLMGALQCGH